LGVVAMLKKQSGQIDIFNEMIFESLIPKDHLLVKIEAFVDFTFVYKVTEELYSEIGRPSIDPVVLFKILLLEFLYRLSDRDVVKRIQTDIAFRWFLRLSLDDDVPDNTTLSYFRSQRLGEEPFEKFFNSIVQQCIEKDLINTRRYIVDSTDVAANVNYPKEKKLVVNAFKRVINELDKFNKNKASEMLTVFEQELEELSNKQEKTDVKDFCFIAKKYAEELYIHTCDEFKNYDKYNDAFVILWQIIEQYAVNKSTDRIISCVDPDARVANKTKSNKKKGYKDHIIVDEDSEIILASEQTPFNVGDEKKLSDLVEKVENNFGLKPEEVSADKVYGTINNRAFLKDNEIVSNINFYDDANLRETYKKYDIKMFEVAEDLKSAKCPAGIETTIYRICKNEKEMRFNFPKEACSKCELRNKCMPGINCNKGYGRAIEISIRYDAVVRDTQRSREPEFDEAMNKRYIVERRFATLVRNHGLRRCRYLRLKGAKIHISIANTACNIVRMVNLLLSRCHSSFAIT
jgi:transposase